MGRMVPPHLELKIKLPLTGGKLSGKSVSPHRP